MKLTEQEAELAIKSAAIDKIRGLISTNLVVNPTMLAEFLFEELKPKVTVSRLEDYQGFPLQRLIQIEKDLSSVKQGLEQLLNKKK